MKHSSLKHLALKHPALKPLAWIVVLLCCWPWQGAPRSEDPVGERLLGPGAGLLASGAWVRFDEHLRFGRYEAAYQVAEQALALDPRSPQGWMYFAAHLARFRTSVETDPDPANRRYWFRAALDLLERGKAQCSDPGYLALTQGLYLTTVALIEEEGPGIGWPGGAEGAWAEADEAFAEAKRLGRDPFAGPLSAPRE